jgi:hypothetical protein
MWMKDVWKLLFTWSLSLLKCFWGHGYLYFIIFSYILTFMCPASLSLYAWTFMCPTFIFLFFLTIDGERDQHISWRFYFVEWNGWMGGIFLRNFWCRSRHVWVECTWSWSWEYEKFLTKVTNNLTKLNAKSSSICIRFSMRSTYGFGRNLIIIEEPSHWFWIYFER